MSGQFWLSDEQIERLRPHFPKPRGKPRVDDRRVLSGILHVLRISWEFRAIERRKNERDVFEEEDKEVLAGKRASRSAIRQNHSNSSVEDSPAA